MNKTEHYRHLGLCLPAIEHDQHWWIANARLAWHIQITVRKSNKLHLILVWRYRISCRMRVQNATGLFKILAWHKKNQHLLDRDCPHPHRPSHKRAEGYPSVLHLHLCVRHENLLRQLVIPCAWQPSARARHQIDLEVPEFRSSESDWRASARISHKIRFDAIAKNNKII